MEGIKLRTGVIVNAVNNNPIIFSKRPKRLAVKKTMSETVVVWELKRPWQYS